MTYQLIISNANYYLADHFFTGDILVADGRIAGIVSPGAAKDLPAERVIDATGLTVLPGIIDSHVHFREPGRTDREDFFTGSCCCSRWGHHFLRDAKRLSPA